VEPRGPARTAPGARTQPNALIGTFRTDVPHGPARRRRYEPLAERLPGKATIVDVADEVAGRIALAEPHRLALVVDARLSARLCEKLSRQRLGRVFLVSTAVVHEGQNAADTAPPEPEQSERAKRGPPRQGPAQAARTAGLAGQGSGRNIARLGPALEPRSRTRAVGEPPSEPREGSSPTSAL